MALAQLCYMIKYYNPNFRPRYHAFIVDHRVRPNSTVEAEVTALRLEQLSTLDIVCPG